MIGVLAKNADNPVVAEFFELFKTPWELFRSGEKYDVLICCGVEMPVNAARLVIIYGGVELPFDSENKLGVAKRLNESVLESVSGRIPIYGNCLAFKSEAGTTLKHETSGQSAICEVLVGERLVVRVGYDLFAEVGRLLTRGQPIDRAASPTLELHIGVLRNLILSHEIPIVEIPAAPAGADFIACLTHDVDHVGIRNHFCDHTMFGFLYRATFGSILNLFKGKASAGQVAANLFAAARLPLVHLGMAKDFWYQFDHYEEIEKGTPSTFYLIPRPDDPGTDANGGRQSMRAAKYDLKKVAPHLRKLQAAGHEIGVHGIDAWRDSTKGREELELVSQLTGTRETGVRMHWLYFDEKSPSVLENAGYSYDSTGGYNETIGYRAGTTQVFRPPGTKEILELPMHVMDTSLFYPSHMNLSPAAANEAIEPLLSNATKFGGVFTVNWHDRSIAPERLWDGFYINLIAKLKKRGAAFLTAARTVAWFRQRRSAKIENVTWAEGMVKLKVSLKREIGVPGLRLRVHKPGRPAVDVSFDAGAEMQIAV